MDQPNPEIRDDSHLNNVGGRQSAQGPPRLDPAGAQRQPGPSEWSWKGEAVRTLPLEPRETVCLSELCLTLSY